MRLAGLGGGALRLQLGCCQKCQRGPSPSARAGRFPGAHLKEALGCLAPSTSDRDQDLPNTAARTGIAAARGLGRLLTGPLTSIPSNWAGPPAAGFGGRMGWTGNHRRVSIPIAFAFPEWDSAPSDTLLHQSWLGTGGWCSGVEAMCLRYPAEARSGSRRRGAVEQ